MGGKSPAFVVVCQPTETARERAMMDFVISISLTALDQDVCGSKARRDGASSRRNAGSEMGI